MKLIKLIYLFGGLSMALAVISCGNDTPEADQIGQTPTQTSSQSVSVPQAPHPETDSKSILTGKVLEAHNGSGYTYIHLETESGNKWIALPETSAPEGEEISVVIEMTMENFESKSLERTFEKIIFCSGIAGAKSDSAVSAQHGTPAGMPVMKQGEGGFADALQKEKSSFENTQSQRRTPMGSTGAIVPFADFKVDKVEGENSYTVAELSEKAAELDGKEVIVRGKVMKVSLSIMGRNWIHIQDGTGNPLKNTHDLVITTAAIPQKDEIIIAKGILGVNRDFGAGYSYGVILEQAEIK